MRFISRITSTFFGVGYFPVAPGTATSLITVFLYKFYLSKLSWPLYLLLLFSLLLVGAFVSTKHSLELNKKDPKTIVIDEAFGQLVILFRMSTAWLPLLFSFLLFRIFDITKPFPIRSVETLPNGWGIMLDDLVAAIYGGVIIYIYLLLK